MIDDDLPDAESSDIPLDSVAYEHPLPDDPPPKALWPVYLFARPKTFFMRCVIEPAPLTVWAAAVIYGVAGTIDRIEIKMLQGRPLPFEDAWVGYWQTALGIGAFTALLYFWIGGWWYRTRLLFSGAVDPDKNMARRVYLFASQIYAIPTVLASLIETWAYTTPSQAANDLRFWYLYTPFVALPFWSVIVSYIGVRTTFKVGKWSSRLWFLILPCVVYVLAFAAIMAVVAVVTSRVAGSGPDLEHQQQHSSDTMQFSYPGNWWIDASDEEYDPDYSITVEPMQDALVDIYFSEASGDADEDLDAFLSTYEESLEDHRRGSEFQRWGSVSGRGRHTRGTLSGNQYEVRMLLGPNVDGFWLVVVEICRVEDIATLESGFELIRSTFKLKSPP